MIGVLMWGLLWCPHSSSNSSSSRPTYMQVRVFGLAQQGWSRIVRRSQLQLGESPPRWVAFFWAGGGGSGCNREYVGRVRDG
jgi:hypothetical protein